MSEQSNTKEVKKGSKIGNYLLWIIIFVIGFFLMKLSNEQKAHETEQTVQESVEVKKNPSEEKMEESTKSGVSGENFHTTE